MFKNTIIILALAITSMLAQNKAFIKKDGNHISIGNNYIERVINISPRDVGTIQIKNRISGKIYNVKSDEFVLRVVFSGVGPAYSKEQNGENPVNLTAKDFKFTGYKENELEGGGKLLTLSFNFDYDVTNYYLNVKYEVYPNNFYMRKWIEVSDSSYGIDFLDKLDVESMSFDKKDFSHGQFGQPVFNDDIFMGVEYPTVENKITGNKIQIGYIVGKEIKKDIYKSHTSVLGASSSPVKLEQTFMDYVDQIKINGTHPYLLYNSWYDFRNPAIVTDSASIMNEKNVLDRIETFKKFMYDKYNIALNAFVLDDGWDNYKSMWGIDSTRFPHGFTPLVNALKSMHTSLGLWASPFCGYSNRDIRVNWGAAHGYEKVGDFLCFAGTKYGAAYKNVMDKYTKEYNVGYFKWDGFLLSCNEPDHGHLPGIYSREANVSTYIKIINSVRKINPKIYINITTGTWLSPWWLKYADCIWMQGADYAYAEEVPSINDRDKSITYRDAVLWDDLQKQHLLFPMSSLMTHGIIKGRLNFLGGKNESLDSFSNEVMMYFGRGVMMWELYVSPDLLSNNEWDAIASSIKWAKANKDVLEKTKMILGNPLKRETYGYIHFNKDKGILLLRNPDVEARQTKIKLTPDLGDIDPSAKYFVKIIYPYNMILPNSVKINQELNIRLDGYEVLTAELIPANEIDKSLPVGIKYSIDKNGLTVYGTPDQKENIISTESKKLSDVNFQAVNGKLEFHENSPIVNNSKTFESKAEINIPSNYEHAKFGFLLEPDTNLQNDSKPEMNIEVNGEAQKLRIEEENGKWFWVLADLKSGKNVVNYKIKFKDNVKGKISSWIFADEKLSGKEIKTGSFNYQEILPAKPYPANIQKIIISIKKNKI